MLFESLLLNISIVVVLIIALIFDYVTKFFSYWYIRHVPYQTPMPFFGSDYHRVLGFRNTTDEVKKLCHLYPNEKFIGTIKSRIPDLIIKDPISIQKVLSTDFSNFHYRGSGLDKSRDVCLRNNLFYSEGTKWTLLRGKLELILNHMDDDIQDNLRDCLSGTNGYTEVQQLLSEILDVVFKDLFLDNNSDIGYIKNLRTLFEYRTLSGKFMSYLKDIFPSLYVMIGFNIGPQENKTYDTLRETKLYKKIKSAEILYEGEKDYLKEKFNQSSNDFAYDILNMFISEGYIPSHITLVSLIYEVAKNQHIQRKVRECDANASDDYLDAVIKETLRLHTPYTTISRKCTKNYNFTEKDLHIDKGITVTIPVDNIHTDEMYYKEAEVFKPDRFLSKDDLGKSTFLPFGLGPRKCIGERLSLRIIRAVVWKILSKFEIRTTEKTPTKLTVTDYNFKRVICGDIWLDFKPIS